MPVKHRHLDDAQLGRLRGLLAERERELRHEIDEELRDEEHLPAEVQRDIDELAETRLALERIAAGEYGNCLDCGRAISWPRLEALPHAVRCITCEALYERGHPPVRAA